MPTLAELKNKWFIPMSGNNPDGVPQRRHTEDAGPNSLTVSTDGNTVTPLIDGKNYMTEWYNQIATLTAAGSGELYHAGWRFEAVRPLGHTVAGNDALQHVRDANTAGVHTIVMICRNMMVMVFNNVSIIWLRKNGVWTSCMDNRFPPGGSNHQKFAVHKPAPNAVAQLGSIDISRTRWDTQSHSIPDPNRDPTFGAPTHDTGVKIEGPAVVDIERSYRERWNDSTRRFGLEPFLPSQPLISTPLSAPAGGGNHSVQVLRTFGITNTLFGYSWSPHGEFTVWAAYLNAIKAASTYIYIEDQYFLPFDWPPCFSRTGLARDTDIVFQLGEAMKRGVHVIILTPSNAEDSTHLYQKYQRDVGVNYLKGVRTFALSPGEVFVSSLQNGGTDVYIHSKLLIVDDEYVAIGSTNVGQRSMTHDGELHVGIVDKNNAFAKNLRKVLWAEHTGRTAASLDNFATAFGHWKTDTASSSGHLKPYPVDPSAVFPAIPLSKPPPQGHATAIRTLVDPYAGPPGIR